MPGSQDVCVGDALCLALVELFLPGQQGRPGSAATPPPNLALTSALHGLLAHSAPAKATAVRLGLHCSLLDSCCAIAAVLAAAAPKASSRNSKLESLKKQRAASAAPPLIRQGAGAGFGCPPAVATGRPGCASSTKSGRRKAASKPSVGGQQEGDAAESTAGSISRSAQALTGPDTDGSLAVLHNTAPMPPSSVGALHEPDKTPHLVQQLLLCLDLLKHLAFESESARWAWAGVAVAEPGGKPEKLVPS
jgi:hypothetical protein